jgi:hypothetical protein
MSIIAAVRLGAAHKEKAPNSGAFLLRITLQ